MTNPFRLKENGLPSIGVEKTVRCHLSTGSLTPEYIPILPIEN